MMAMPPAQTPEDEEAERAARSLRNLQAWAIVTGGMSAETPEQES